MSQAIGSRRNTQRQLRTLAKAKLGVYRFSSANHGVKKMSPREIATSASNQFLKIGERLGVPTAVLACLMVFGYYFTDRLFTEALVPMTQRHLQFIDEVSATNKQVAASTEKNAETQRQVSESLRKFSSLLEGYETSKIRGDGADKAIECPSP